MRKEQLVHLTVKVKDCNAAKEVLRRVDKKLEGGWAYLDIPLEVTDEVDALVKTLRALVESETSARFTR